VVGPTSTNQFCLLRVPRQHTGGSSLQFFFSITRTTNRKDTVFANGSCRNHPSTTVFRKRAPPLPPLSSTPTTSRPRRPASPCPNRTRRNSPPSEGPGGGKAEPRSPPPECPHRRVWGQVSNGPRARGTGVRSGKGRTIRCSRRRWQSTW
jgi:hypothetical protein